MPRVSRRWARPRRSVTGNLKFDVGVPDAALALGRELRLRFGESRPVWVAGSTREGEEALILDALAAPDLPADTLTVIVPRHPQRFDAVADAACASAAFRSSAAATMRRSRPTSRVVLGDSMGEMLGYFAAADVVFVGGSLLPLGGQNLIEPIALGRPVLVGPAHVQFRGGDRQRARGRRGVRSRRCRRAGREVARASRRPGRRAAMREAARAFHAAHRGAGERLWEWLAPQLARAARVSRESSRLIRSTSSSESVPTDCFSLRALMMKL